MSDSVELWKYGEYKYSLAADFVPNIVKYIHEDDDIRPAMLIVPGGGYGVVSPTEGEIVAKEFYNRGFNSFVLSYTTDVLMMAPLHRQPLADIARAVRLIRKNARRFKIDEDQVIACGFSAGGHLVGSLCTHFADVVDYNPRYNEFSCIPNAAILSYPVILGNELGHEDSIKTLIGDFGTTKDRDYFSLEKHVKEDTPPCFIWHTATDETVPVQNSIQFAKSLQEADINYALHIFSDGPHGLSLANDLWVSGKFGSPYTMKQTRAIINQAQTGELVLNDSAKERLEIFMNHNETHPRKASKEVAIWPTLAEAWLRRLFDY